jgi:hypothetical protein
VSSAPDRNESIFKPCVIGWGADIPDLRVLTERDANGNDVFDVSFAPEAVAYRASKVPLEMLDIGALRETTARW